MRRIPNVNNFSDSKLLGSMIRINRLEQNMSQIALGEGICVPSYLSRIENAEIIPSHDVVSELFDALGLSYYDEETFIMESKQLFEDFKQAMFFNDLKRAALYYEKIKKDESKYLNSPIIIDFLLVKFVHLSASIIRDEINKLTKMLDSVTMHMTLEQLHLYWIYMSIDEYYTTGDCLKSEKYLLLSDQYGKSGKLYLEFAKLYYQSGMLLMSLEYIHKAQNIFSETGNILGLITTYELKGLIFIYDDHYELGIIQLKQCLDFLNRIDEPSYVSSVNNHISWAYYQIVDISMAKIYFERCIEDERLLTHISKDLMEGLIYTGEIEWLSELDEIEKRLLFSSGRSAIHKNEQKFLEQKRDELLRSQRKYKSIDDYHLQKRLSLVKKSI